MPISLILGPLRNCDALQSKVANHSDRQSVAHQSSVTHVSGIGHGPRVKKESPPPVRKQKPKNLRDFSCEQEPWDTFLVHFRLVKDYNLWSDEIATKYLALCLKGHSLDYYVDLPETIRGDHDRLCQALVRRFGCHRSLEKVRNQLSRLKQKPDQSFEDLAQEVRRLAIALYAGAGADRDRDYSTLSECYT